MAAPNAEGLCLEPADTYHRIVVVCRGAEIVAGKVVVHGVGVVVNPAQGVGIHVDSLFVNECRAVVQTTGTGGIEGTAVFLTVLHTGFLAGCIGIVNPVVFIVQFGSVNLATAKISVFLSYIEVIQGLACFCIVPAYFGLLVQPWGIQRFTVLIFFNLVFAFHAGFGKHSANDRVGHPEYELTVLVIGDFGLVHKERRNLHRAGLVGHTIGVVLYTGSHAEVALVNKNHAFQVDVLKLGAVEYSHQFSIL